MAHTSITDGNSWKIFPTLGLTFALLCGTFWFRSRQSRSSLRDMPGPPAMSWLWGSSPEIPEFEARGLQHEWLRKYGRTFKISSLLMTDMLYVADPKALAHIMSHPAFERTPALRTGLDMLVGDGMLSAEGLQHKQQRRVMNPAFGPMELRKHTEVFIAKSNELCDIWKTMCAESELADGVVALDAFSWLNKAALDIIGLAGFNYNIDSLHAPDDQPNEVITAVRNMFSFSMEDPFFFLQLFVPIFRLVPTRRLRQTRESQAVIRRIGMRLIADMKALILKSQSNTDGSSTVKKTDVEGSDLLSLLIKANMAADLPDSQRLSDESILAQIPTFLVAGYETTSTAVSWALFALTCAPQVQTKLRHELRSIKINTPSMDELNSLSYLDKVVREVLRLYSPVSNTERVAVQDSVIPLSVPYTDKKGVLRHEIIIEKGESIFAPIFTLNTSPEIWGYDASSFRPERWNAIPEAAKQIPNVWGNIAAFAAGPHACIGYRFALVEMKALLFALIRSFEFELAVSPVEIIRKTSIVGRPVLVTNPSAGYQLPVFVRRAEFD